MKLVGAGAASSWQLLNRHQTMIAGQYQHGFAVDWMRKDLQICLQEAVRNGSSLPVTALVDQFYGELQQQGWVNTIPLPLLLRLKMQNNTPLRSHQAVLIFQVFSAFYAVAPALHAPAPRARTSIKAIAAHFFDHRFIEIP